jgi:hypothetical protein
LFGLLSSANLHPLAEKRVPAVSAARHRHTVTAVRKTRSHVETTLDEINDARRHIKHATTFQDRLATWSKQIRQQAAALPPGPERADLLRRAQQADTASYFIEEWTIPGLQPQD